MRYSYNLYKSLYVYPVNMWAIVIRYTTKANYNKAVRRTKEHHGIFTYKLMNNHFCHSIPVTFNGNFQLLHKIEK